MIVFIVLFRSTNTRSSTILILPLFVVPRPVPPSACVSAPGRPRPWGNPLFKHCAPRHSTLSRGTYLSPLPYRPQYQYCGWESHWIIWHGGGDPGLRDEASATAAIALSGGVLLLGSHGIFMFGSRGRWEAATFSMCIGDGCLFRVLAFKRNIPGLQNDPQQLIITNQDKMY